MKSFTRFLLTVFLGSLSLAALAQPTSNPYTDFYGPTPGGHWSDSLQWPTVYDFTAYAAPGLTTDQQYALACSNISAAGGGVLFFAAGTYTFTEDIELWPSVILRGETPSMTNAKDSAYALATKFAFPEYIPTFTGGGTPNSTAFKRIINRGDLRNSGMVYIDVNRAAISIYPETEVPYITPQGDTIQIFGGDTRNIILFGLISNNVARPDPGVPTSGQLPWQRFSHRFASNIGIWVQNNSVIANCRLNNAVTDSYVQPGYLAQNASNVYVPIDSVWATFSYTDHYGIYINRHGSSIPGYTPAQDPNGFAKGGELRDNWMYKTMRVGIMSGGQGTILDGNVVRDRPNKRVYLRPNGQKLQFNNSATYENRGIDWSGWDITVINNDIQVTRHLINGGPYLSIDGEGILFQECCGGTTINGVRIRHNIMDSTYGDYIGIWKARDIFDAHIDSNELGGHPIYMTANTNGNTYTLNGITIDNNQNVSNIFTNGSEGGQLSYIRNNVGAGGGKITRPCHVQVSGNVNLSLDPCDPVFPFTADVVMMNPMNDTVLNAGGVVLTLQAQATTTGDSVEFWSDITKLATVSTNSPTATWLVPIFKGDYFIRAKIKEGNLDVWSDAIKVTVQNGLTGATGLTKALKQNKLEARLFPQPTAAGQTAYVALAETVNSHNLEVAVYTADGKQVYSRTETGGQNQIALPALSKGFYVVRLVSPQGAAALKWLVY